MKKCFKSIWFYLGFIVLLFVIIIGCGQYSDFELDDHALAITPINFTSKTDILFGTLILPNQNNIRAVAIFVHGDGYAISQGGASSISADLLMIASVIVCGLGYAEGATLTKALGGWQVICWALIVSLPPMLILSFILMPEELATISVSA